MKARINKKQRACMKALISNKQKDARGNMINNSLANLWRAFAATAEPRRGKPMLDTIQPSNHPISTVKCETS